MDILKKLCKIAGIKCYEKSIRHLESADISDPRNLGIKIDESTETIFSKENLIDGKYHYIRKCDVSGNSPDYRTRFIRTMSEDNVKSILLSYVPKVLKRRLKCINLETYRLKDGRYRHIVNLETFNGDKYSDLEISPDKVESRLNLYGKIIKFLNHVRYERNKISKKKQLLNNKNNKE